ncbi:hypothetical protein ASPCAL14158 [Aspergillus calidoustus]|uniref:Uncharacterized protein n=1 Tax=Aspergillus calidoustus TaxID=454130 RepID=A0A0U5GGF0_ASPCI|nr:hypothetical protein ASPCAL14158 [Aspergillus calidoustus]
MATAEPWTVTLEPLPDNALNIACPIKMILIWALKKGLVYGTAIEQVLQHTSQQPGGKVLYKYPDRPIFSTFESPRALTPTDDLLLSVVGHLGRVKDMASRDGVKTRFTAHGIRRGAARDAAPLDKPMEEVEGHQAESTVDELLNQEPDAFVSCFSRINAVQSSGSPFIIPEAIRGNSRDEPQQFLLVCQFDPRKLNKRSE